MIYTYKVEEKDFLTFQLYHLSQASEFKGRINKQRISVLLLNVALAIFFIVEKKYGLSFLFILIGVTWFFLYPVRVRRTYKTRFENEILDKYQKHFGVEAKFEINDDQLKTADEGGYSEKHFNDILKVVHLPDVTFIIFKNKQTFILPQATTTNFADLVVELDEKATQFQIPIERLPNWKW